MSELQKISLTINEPANDVVLVASSGATGVNVAFSGEVTSSTHEPSSLNFTWYSSLQAISEDEPFLGRGLSFGPAELSVGSHIITLLAKDQDDSAVDPDDLAVFYESVLHIGAAGGPPDPPPQEGEPCVIHVLVANMLIPAPSDNYLSKASPMLSAEVPSLWANYIEDDPPRYEGINQDYHAVNRIRYRWDIRPQGEPVSAAISIGATDNSDLFFVAAESEGEENLLRYERSLPESVVIGDNYTVRLCVVDKNNENVSTSVERTLTVN